MDDYPNLKYCLSCFDELFDLDFETYRNSFKDAFKHGYINQEGLRIELNKILLDESFLWKDFLKDKDVFFYDAEKTESDLYMDFKLLVWDLLFPELVLNNEGMNSLKGIVIDIIKKTSTTEESEWVFIDDILFELDNNPRWSNCIDYYDLIRMVKETSENDINVKYYQPELWFFKLA